MGCGVTISDEEHKRHLLIAEAIVRDHRLTPGKYDLAAQIVSALDHIRAKERELWQINIDGTAELYEQQGKHEAARALRIFLEYKAP